MSSSGRSDRTHSSPTAPRPAPAEVRVVNWPLRDEGWSAALRLLLFVAIVIVTGWKLDAYAAALGALALAVAAWRFWIPVTWELNSHGVTETVLGRSQRIPWTAIGGWREFGSGVLLLPEADLAPVLALRGRFVAWGRHRIEVLAQLEHYAGPALRSGRP